mmetsp:Transcript_114148/g.233568  ORF Transcript_114148/g.233568 Transcript_114148/m.233568 type:complete len:209 (+) Transcript_114148:1220-1846(+)
MNSGRSWSSWSSTSMPWYFSHRSGASCDPTQTFSRRSALDLFRSSPSSNMRSGRSFIACPSSSFPRYSSHVSGMNVVHSISSCWAPAGTSTAAAMYVTPARRKTRAVKPRAMFWATSPALKLKRLEGLGTPAVAAAAATADGFGVESDTRRKSWKNGDDAEKSARRRAVLVRGPGIGDTDAAPGRTSNEERSPGDRKAETAATGRSKP